jgi:hypothetical protein
MTDWLCRYATDRDGRLVFVDAGWCRFARENAAESFALPERIYGRPLFSFISDPTTLHVYAALMDRVANQRRTIVIPFRCDGPPVRRWLELQMSPRAGGGIDFATRQLRAERRPVPLPFDRPSMRGDVMMKMCSWCKNVQMESGHWARVEDAVRTFQIFSEADVPLITHGICPDCVTLFERDARR